MARVSRQPSRKRAGKRTAAAGFVLAGMLALAACSGVRVDGTVTDNGIESLDVGLPF